MPFIEDILKSLPHSVELFVEPFAGGASVSLQLAASQSVGQVLIADSDELVASFWMTAAFDCEWLADAVVELEVTLDAWHRMRDWRPRSRRDQAIKCLFLNRTSFSGILHSSAGPIGGQRQASDYPIDCRFPRSTLYRRIRAVGELAAGGGIDRVLHADYRETIAVVRQSASFTKGNTVFFLDPPFFAKSPKLYREGFSSKDHDDLAKHLRRLRYPWILSYDDHPDVRTLYNSHRGRSALTLVKKYYRASAGENRSVTELIITNALDGSNEC